MRKIIILIAILSGHAALGQGRVSVQVYPGTELLNVVQTLADTGQAVKSTYRQEIIAYFKHFENHRAVKLARALPYINCDFPLRLSWAFYDFPHVKLAKLHSLVGYERWFTLQQVNDYFVACLEFYNDTKFWDFYQSHQPEYNRWISSFNRNLSEKKLLDTLNSFYRVKPNKDIVFTLGATDCGTYVVSDLNLINPVLSSKITVILVAYGSVIRDKDDERIHPSFYAPIWVSQLVWHEMGHAYLSDIFNQNAQAIAGLKYIFDRDTAMKKAGGVMGWTAYFNENMTQAVTSVLRIHNGVMGRDAEMKRVAAGEFFYLMPAIMDIIESKYYHKRKYKDFAAFFPELLTELRKRYPE